jgi:hypothetical protein
MNFLKALLITCYVLNAANMRSIDATVNDAIVESVRMQQHMGIELRFCFQIAQHAL